MNGNGNEPLGMGWNGTEKYTLPLTVFDPSLTFTIILLNGWFCLHSVLD